MFLNINKDLDIESIKKASEEVKKIIGTSLEMIDPKMTNLSLVIENIIGQELNIQEDKIIKEEELMDLEYIKNKEPDPILNEEINKKIEEFKKSQYESYIIVLEDREFKENSLRKLLNLYIETTHGKHITLLLINKHNMRCLLNKKYDTTEDLLLQVINGTTVEKMLIDEKVKTNIEFISEELKKVKETNLDKGNESFKKYLELQNYKKEIDYILNCMNIGKELREKYKVELEFVKEELEK